MKILQNSTEDVFKFLHEDKSETCIKTTPSRKYNNKLEVIEEDKNKYSIIISLSSGCQMHCGFCGCCHMKYTKLSEEQVLLNVIDAVSWVYEKNPTISEKNVKLCWMGMGEPFLNIPLVISVTEKLKTYLIDTTKWAKGLDSVDIGTTMPWHNEDSHLLLDFPVRIFYSLHSGLDWLMPGRMGIEDALAALKPFKQVIYHQVFLECCNDFNDDLNILRERLNEYPRELRVLRFNSSQGYEESIKFEDIIRLLNSWNIKTKYQISPGKSVNGACGMFLGKG